jgi:hypothetical protein
MVNTTRTPAQILTPSLGGNVSAAQMVQLLEEYEGAIDAASVSVPVAVTVPTVTVTAADANRVFVFSSGFRGFSLPGASAVPVGFRVRMVVNIAGNAQPVALSVGGGSTLNGGQVAGLNFFSGFVEFVSDGVSNWTMLRTSDVAQGVAATRNVGTEPGNLIEVLEGQRLPVLDGTNLTNTGGRRPYAPVTVTNQTALNLTGFNASLFMGYEVFFSLATLGTGGQLTLQMSADNGASWIAGGSDYDANAWRGDRAGSVEEGGSAAGGASAIAMTGVSDLAATARIAGSLRILFPDQLAPTLVEGAYGAQFTTGFGRGAFAGMARGNTAINAIRFRFGNGAAFTGTAQLVGMLRGAA